MSYSLNFITFTLLAEFISRTRKLAIAKMTARCALYISYLP